MRAVTACRVHSIGADVFTAQIAASARNRERFERDASTYVYRELTKSLSAFIASELDETSEGVDRLTLEDGHVIVREGDPSEHAFLILGGNAKVWKTIDGEARELTRLGAGQIFGEVGALEGTPRTATVVADGGIELLEIGRDAFVRWHEAHPNALGFFQSLSHVYTLSEGRKVNLFLGQVGGESAITAVVGKPTDGVVSTRVLSQGVVVFTNARADAIAGERDSITYADDAIKRELRLIVKERKGEKVGRAVVYAVSAEGIENDLGTLYQHVLGCDDVEAVALRRFERTGFLGGNAERIERICPCLGLGRDELCNAVAELGNDFDTLQANIGVGAICGGCERAVRAFLEHGGEVPHPDLTCDTGPQPQAPLATPGDEPQLRRGVADVPRGLLNRDERQLAGLLARGIGTELDSVTREQVAVRLRATGVRDMNAFIDMLFPGVFTEYARATYATLAAAVGRGIGFGPWRVNALKPPSRARTARLSAAQAAMRLGRPGVAAVVFALLAISIAVSPTLAAGVWLPASAALVLAQRALSRTPSGRAVLAFLVGGPARFYRALFGSYGESTTVATFRLGSLGSPIHIVRGEEIVDHILQNPHVYARNPVVGYPPFAEHSVLGGGSSGVWLGYRMLCEEYFSEDYREDLDEMRATVRERIASWCDRSSIQLLDEIYRISIEIRARVFFQCSFDCFDDHAPVNFAAIVDRVLHPPTLLFADMCDGEVEVLRERVTRAVAESSRPKSVGYILREAWKAGDLDEREACENAVMYVLAQAPTMGIFWTLYRAAHLGTQTTLRENRREIVKAIKEELRLHAPVASMFGREVLRDDRLGDLPVKAGDKIVMSPMYIHTNPRQWSDPFAYDAQRWTSTVGDGKEIVEPATDPDDSRSRPQARAVGQAPARYLPFGGGGQACQGRWFASDEMLLVVEEILAAYELEILDDQGLLAKPLAEQVRFHVYNRPFNDVRMRPRRRESQPRPWSANVTERARGA